MFRGFFINVTSLFIKVFFIYLCLLKNMESIDRIVISNDWVTLLILGIVILIVVANFVDQKRLHSLFVLPFNKSYRLNYSNETWQIFNFLFFVISNLILSLYLFVIIQKFNPNFIAYSSYPFLKIVLFVIIYWVFRYSIGKLTAVLFEIKKINNEASFIKMSYYYSSTLYLLIFLIFSLYFFESNTLFLYITSSFFVVLLLLRYLYFLNYFKSFISSHFFYFILYLCTLEIAPLLIVFKIGV